MPCLHSYVAMSVPFLKVVSVSQDASGKENHAFMLMLDLLEWNLEHGLSQGSFNDLLEILRLNLPKMFPEGTLPKNYQEAIGHLSMYGLPSKSVDICVNGCCRFDGEHAMCRTCSTCGADRWAPEMLEKPLASRIGKSTFHYWNLPDLLKRNFAVIFCGTDEVVRVGCLESRLHSKARNLQHFPSNSRSSGIPAFKFRDLN